MPENRLTPDELVVLAKRQGLAIAPSDAAALHGAYLSVMEMTALVRGTRGHEAEAALIFDPQKAASR